MPSRAETYHVFLKTIACYLHNVAFYLQYICYFIVLYNKVSILHISEAIQSKFWKLFGLNFRCNSDGFQGVLRCFPGGFQRVFWGVSGGFQWNFRWISEFQGVHRLFSGGFHEVPLNQILFRTYSEHKSPIVFSPHFVMTGAETDVFSMLIMTDSIEPTTR